MKPTRSLVSTLCMAAALCLAASCRNRETATPASKSLQTVNLLSLVDPKLDQCHPEFTFDGEALLVTPKRQYGQVTRLHIPYVPPEEYDVRMTVERTGKLCPGFEGKPLSGLAMILVQGGRQAVVVIDELDIDKLDDSWREVKSQSFFMQGNESHHGKVLKDGMLLGIKTPTEVLWSVRKDAVTVTLAGKDLIQWKPGFGRFYVRHNWSLPTRESLGLGSFSSQFRLTRLELVPLSGEGRAIP